jgi:small-conductance mechanosensitive channel/TolA-binding protein
MNRVWKFTSGRAAASTRGPGRARLWHLLWSFTAAALLTFVAANGQPPGAQRLTAASTATGNIATGQPAFPLTSDQVAGHLGESVDWFHHLAPIEQLQITGADSATRERLHQQSLTAVRLAFEFGKACAVLLDAESRLHAASSAAAPAAAGPAASATTAADTSTPAKGLAGRLDQAAANVAQRIDGLQSQLDSLKEQIAKARGNERETLVAQQGQVNAALQLAREVQASVQDMENFEATSIAGDNGNLSPLDGQIVDMERSIPELRTLPPTGTRSRAGSGGGAVSRGSAANGGGGSGAGASAEAGASGSGGGGSGGSGSSAAVAGGARAVANTFRAENAGVIALITEWFSLHDMRRQLGGYIKETGDLQDETEKVRGPLVNQVRDVVGDDLAISTSTDPAQLVAQRQALEADTARFKQLSKALVPLGEQALVVESAMSALDDWKETLESRMTTVVRYMAIRIGIVLGWIAVVLIVSDIWRRATFRYLHDQRRQRQFLALRRVAVGIALTLVIVFGLVSEIGSIATYIGFVTAGIAVALQNVILAVVAYFFLIGRYGVRVGDRITLAGVTGRVVDIGLVRIYLMELAGSDLHATGRMVVLSNAVLFQPTAMFKQIPGADYVWHTVTLTIAATADVLEAHKRLKAAAEQVYQKYRPAIERQHAMVQRFIDFDANSPQPEVRVRLTENGLECSVRYPVELENAAVIDQQMLKALRDALEQDAQFKLVSTGAVVLKSSDD